MTITAPRIIRRVSQRNRQGWVGVDIGTSTLKVAQVERRSGQWRLCFGQILPITPGATASVDGLRQTLTESLRSSGSWLTPPAACLLPWSSTNLRSTELPPAADDELAQLVAAEIEDAEAAEDCQVAHWRAACVPGGTEPTPVHILSIPTDTASSAVRSLSAAKLDCRVVDARPFALARAAAMSPDAETDKTVAAVDWGFSQVSVILVRNGRPYFTRLLHDDGLCLVLDSIQHGLKLSYDEACALLRRFTLQVENSMSSDDVTTAIRNLTREPLEHTTRELKRTLSFAAQEHTDLKPEQVLLFGGGATVRGIEQLVTSGLGIPAKVWSLDRGASGESTPSVMLAEAIALSAIPLWS